MTNQQMTGVHDVMSSTFLSSGTAAVKHCQKFQVTICGGDWGGTSTLKNREKCQFFINRTFLLQIGATKKFVVLNTVIRRGSVELITEIQNICFNLIKIKPVFLSCLRGKHGFLV